MNARHMKVAQAMQNTASRKLREMDPEAMTAGELVRMIDTSIKLERQARGERQVVEHRHVIVLAKIVDIILANVPDPAIRERIAHALEGLDVAGLLESADHSSEDE